MKLGKIDLLNHMTDANAREFVRILHENKNEKGEVYIQLPSGTIATLQLTDDVPLRSIDQPQSPRYRHDCDVCTFLGQYEEYDLYYCDQKAQDGLPTAIARYSDFGPDYFSGLGFKMPALAEAEKRAREKGLIS